MENENIETSTNDSFQEPKYYKRFINELTRKQAANKAFNKLLQSTTEETKDDFEINYTVDNEKKVVRKYKFDVASGKIVSTNDTVDFVTIVTDKK
jgi:hypothetical protein